MTEQTHAVTLATPRPDAPGEEEYRLLMTQAKHAIDSGLLPAAIKTPQQALVILRKGRELGIPDMYALSNIAVVNGKPTAMAELMLALVYRAYGGNAARVIETSAKRAVVRYQRPEWDEPSLMEFTIEEAEQAGLLKKGETWAKYPAAMLRWRAVSAALKLGFPEILAGLYTPEELGAPVVIDASGEAWIDAEAAEPAARIVNPDTGEIVDRDELEMPAELIDTPPNDLETHGREAVMRASPYKPASINQLATIAKLARLLGKPEEPSEDMTSAEASDRITELSRAYQERKGSASRAEPVAASENPTTDAARTQGLLQLSEAITALADARSDDPKVVFQAGVRHLGLQAQRSADLDLAEMEAIRGWAQTQLTLVHEGAHEPAVEVEEITI